MEENARDTISMFLRGEPVDVHQVMMAAEEASISIEMLAEIRNKLTDAYRSIMNMQI
jgi:flagellar hook-basal body complex protein FliE